MNFITNGIIFTAAASLGLHLGEFITFVVATF